MTKKTQTIKVGFTEQQHNRVRQFLDFIKPTVIRDFGSSVNVTVDWSADNEMQRPCVTFEGGGLKKSIGIKEILEADDASLPAPVLRVLPGGKP